MTLRHYEIFIINCAEKTTLRGTHPPQRLTYPSVTLPTLWGHCRRRRAPYPLFKSWNTHELQTFYRGLCSPCHYTQTTPSASVRSTCPWNEETDSYITRKARPLLSIIYLRQSLENGRQVGWSAWFAQPPMVLPSVRTGNERFGQYTDVHLNIEAGGWW